MNSNFYPHLQNQVPATLREAIPLLGIAETPGLASNSKILKWALEVKEKLGANSLQYSTDSIPWCGLFAAIVCLRAGWGDQMPKDVLWARSWANFGQKSEKPSLGDILVFKRNSGGHVGFYVAEDSRYYHVLGGNQSDAVTITRLAKSNLLAARQPKWRIQKPLSAQPMFMKDAKSPKSQATLV